MKKFTRHLFARFFFGFIMAAAGLCVAAGLTLAFKNIPRTHSQISAEHVIPPSAPQEESLLPRTITINKLSIEAPVVLLGLNNNGSLQVPSHPSDVGWYIHSAVPGMSGNTIMVGHYDSTFGAAVFYKLETLQPGDTISVTRSDGNTSTYTVKQKESFPVDAFPSEAVYGQTSTPTLTLLTCAGTYNRSSGHYNKNLVVTATLQ